MRAMILAAGVGSRLSPLTLFLPKPMAPLANKPVMEHLVNLLARHDIREITANLNYLPGQIESYFGDGRRWGVNITYSLERNLLGTAGAVRRVGDIFTGTFVVLMGDALTDLDLTAMLEFHRSRQALATIALLPVDDPSRFGVVQVDESGRILRFQEKPAREEAVSNLVSMGVYIFEPQVLNLIPAGQVYDFGHQLFPLLLEKGLPFYGYQGGCYWSDVGSFGEYRNAQEAILAQKVQGIAINGRQDAPGVWIGHNTLVHPQARLVPPVIIGANCQVRASAEIGPQAVIGDHVIVDEGASVAHSTVLENTYLGRLVNVQQAVVNRNCLVSVPANTSVFVSDRFLLGETGERVVWQGLARFVEVLLALLLLALSLPLWPIAALLALFAGPGAWIQRQPLLTNDPQALWKSGRVAARTVGIPAFRASPHTRAGRLLLRVGWHNLPALLSVLKGDLALVGVGPLAPEQSAALQEDWHHQRFLVPAGLTGLWYINPGEPADLDGQLIADSYYAVTRTWREDRRILARTPAAWWRRLWAA